MLARWPLIVDVSYWLRLTLESERDNRSFRSSSLSDLPRSTLVAGFALGWSNMVHVADSGNPSNLWYYSVLVVGLIGACLARLKAPGLASTLFVMAATLALIAVMLPSGASPYLARNMVIGHAVNVVLFTASGLLFRHASFSRMK